MENLVSERLKIINEKLEPYNPKIIAVTKYFDETKIVEYYNLGIRDFGENRVLAALDKISKLPDEIVKTSRFHLIGHLQTNKVKYAVGKFYLIHSVDSYRLAEAISEEACRQGIKQKILLQINNAGEESKFGFSPDEIEDCMGDLIKLPSLSIDGLMNIAPLSQNNDYLRMLFKNMKEIKDILEQKYKVELNELSMGMSNDYEIAVQEGSTIVRLGRILFENNTMGGS